MTVSKRYTTRAIVLGLAAIVAAQVFQPRTSNPPVEASKTIGARLAVTPEVGAIFDRSCRDCHSNDTVWPWYSTVSPASWFVVSHVNDGRRHLNLSDWAQYDARQADHKLEEMCEHVRDGEMPMSSYTWLHAEAKLSPEDVAVVCAWAERARSTGAADPAVPREP
jgi:hypothetical protein